MVDKNIRTVLVSILPKSVLMFSYGVLRVPVLFFSNRLSAKRKAQGPFNLEEGCSGSGRVTLCVRVRCVMISLEDARIE